MIDGRLVGLRAVEDGDLEFLATLANDRTVRSMVVGWDWPVSAGAQQDWLGRVRQDPLGTRLAIVEKQSRSVIGLTGLWDVDWRTRSAMAGIKIMPGSAPRGAGSDAIMLVNAWALYEVGLRRLYSTILSYNGPSMGAYVRRCGWRIEGREREAVFKSGEWRDLFRVALLRSDFLKLDSAREYIDYVCATELAVDFGTRSEEWRSASAP